MSDIATLNIHQVARAAGLTTSLLRVWESRYGWPSPRRLRNGYRIFTRHQMEEVVRAAALVRSGLAIGKLIVDALPRWPAEPERQQLAQPLTNARAFSAPTSVPALRLRDEILDALERSHPGRIREQLQLAPLELRPHDELVSVLVPALVGLCELERRGRRLAAHQELVQLIAARARQLTRPVRGTAAQILLSCGDDALPIADVVVAVLSMRGCAVTRTPGVGDGVPVVVENVAPVNAHGARIAALSSAEVIGIAQLVDAAVHPLALLEHAAALAV
jgi:DNA-binding transcriptional MerR regulator